MAKSPAFLAFMIAMLYIYILANWKAKIFTKVLCIPTLAIVAGVLGAIAFTPDTLSFSIFLQVALLNLVFTGCFYPVFAGKFLRKRRAESNEEKDAEKAWLEANFKKKKKR